MVISLTYKQLLADLNDKENISNIDIRPLASAVGEDKNIDHILKQIDDFFRDVSDKYICSEDLKSLAYISTTIEKWLRGRGKSVFDVGACCNILPDEKGSDLLRAYTWGVVADLCFSAQKLAWPVTHSSKFLREKYFEVIFQNPYYYAIKELMSPEELVLYESDFEKFESTVSITKRGMDLARSIRGKMYPDIINAKK